MRKWEESDLFLSMIIIIIIIYFFFFFSFRFFFSVLNMTEKTEILCEIHLNKSIGKYEFDV